MSGKLLLLLVFIKLNELCVESYTFLEVNSLPCRRIYPKHTAVKVNATKRRPDMCCGLKPFNSTTHICCAGKVISTETHHCCLDGSILPIGKICHCNPVSAWAINKTWQISDGKAQLEFLKEEAHEVIVNHKTLLSSLEQDIVVEHYNADEVYQRISTFFNDSTNSNQIEHIINMVVFIEESKANISDMMQDIVFEEIQQSLENYADIDELRLLVFEHKRLLEQISKLSIKREKYLHHLKIVKAIISIVNSDLKLLSHMKSVFNKQATLVSELEFAILNYTNSQKFVLDQNKNTSTTFQIGVNSKSLGFVFLTYEMFRDPKAFTIPFIRASKVKTMNVDDKHGCNLEMWSEFYTTVIKRIPLVYEDLKLIMSKDESLEEIKSKVMENFFHYGIEIN